MSPSNLSRAITSEEWIRAAQLAKNYPHQAQVWTKRDGFFDGRTRADVLPLHEALMGGAPIECVMAIVKASPIALTEKESSFQRLPLHCACRSNNADSEVIEFVARSHKHACLEPDMLERLPIHYALSNGADPAAIRVLMKFGPEAARGFDHRGWTPVHVAAHAAASETVVKTLLDAYPEVVLTRTNRGHSIKRVIPPYAPNRRALSELVMETKEAVNEAVNLPKMQEKSLESAQLTIV